MLHHPLNIHKPIIHETPTVESTTIYTDNSLIFGQQTVIEQLLPPVGISLGSVPSLTPIEGALGYDKSTPSSLWIANGTIWNEITSSGSGEGNVSFTGSSVVANDVVIFSGTTGRVIADSGATIASGSHNSGTNTGDVTLTAYGSSPNANGGSLSGQALTLQPASVSFPGGITTGSQAFTGLKDFSATGIVLSTSANLGVASGTFNNYGYYYFTNCQFTYSTDHVNVDLICERVGNLVAFTPVTNVYFANQHNATITSQVLPSFFGPFADRFIGLINTIQSTATSGLAIGSCALRAGSGSPFLEFGSALQLDNDGTGQGLHISPYPTGGGTGYGNGIVQMTYVFAIT